MRSQNRKCPVGILIIGYALLSCFSVGFQLGNVILLVIGGLLIADGRWGLQWNKKIQRVFQWGWRILLTFSLIMAAAMGFAAYGHPLKENTEPETMIVLGARINGRQPSLILRRRLEAAVQAWNMHPQSAMIVSGGQGNGEDCPESEVMKNWLIDHGVDRELIVEEDQSRNTGENLRYSQKIIAEQGLSKKVVLVTDSFHQLRVEILANVAGLEKTASICSKTPWELSGMYAVREVFGIVKAILFHR